ncbi:hypothetical protein A9Z64_05270 [Moraxella osloensis]|jgi:hypothetical protein|uniref:Uncharacterized protein n=1 Tax=Faucicola osloensis TaxID=34062 RepID=A0A378QWY5_FAUOS|nr:hypothetical protein [Moraxella osloensis]NOX79216.1 hypothetical protein [Gammaproteobacteria bacterium]AME02589.1 hypothetical protein AXE82_11800 [Moraxella osloensis]OBX57201.1 hypothetical protein A9Z64_05270 [Moraxella osloensis]STZ04904.1 Uncharacterised protein [Moraxella osloensis]STZ04942.1 Uncharacterised protein [Moraxella osloensis]
MKNELTKSENELLDRLVREFEAKIAKSKRLADEQLLMLTLFQKALLSDSDLRKLRLLLGFEQAKITARETKKKAKLALQMHENEKKQVIENRYRRFGLVIIESLKKLPENKATISLSDFLNLMLADENLNEKDKEWVSGFLQNDVMNGDPKD